MNGETEPEQPPPNEPDEGFETEVETYDDDPGEGFEVEPLIKSPQKEKGDRHAGEGFEIERQT